MMEMEQRCEIIAIDTKMERLRIKLKDAIESRYQDEFRKLIHDSNIPICCSALESYEPGSQMSAFEFACNNWGSEEFITDCISIGCDSNRRNPKCGRKPISFAIEAFDKSNLEALLSDTSVGVDFEHSTDFPFTPINYLLERIESETFAFKYGCFELLVKHCADVNAPGKCNRTPIQSILENESLNEVQKRTLIQCIFDHAKYVDVDSDDGRMRAQLNELLPDLELPPAGIQRNDIDQHLSLQDGNEAEFWQHFRDKATVNWHSELRFAVARGLTYSIERIFRLGGTGTTYSSLSTPYLDNYLADTLLTKSISLMDWGDDDKLNSDKCLNLFLNHRKVDVNAKTQFNQTPLLYSIESKNSHLTTKLLKRGAYFGVDGDCETAIPNLKPQILEQHFDSCLTTNDRHASDEYLELTFDYKNLIPIHKKVASPKLWNSTKFCEMKAIELIAETSTLRHLLAHPLIESFLDIKWNRLSFIFYTNFFLYGLFAMSNVFYIFYFFLDGNDSNLWMTVCQMILLCGMIGREATQIICTPCVYFKNVQNCLECVLIGLIMFILFGECPTDWRGTVAATAMLLIAWELSFLLGSLPMRFFAIHFAMLATVAKNFFKSLLLYSTILVAFALIFSSLFHKKQLTAETNMTSPSNESDDEHQREEYFHNFRTIGFSLLKVMAMANGELNTSSINFHNNAFAYVVFVAFVLLVTIVLGNLLNGLAVSDINEIRSQAELIHLTRRVEVLAEYERVFLEKRSWINWFPLLERFVRSKIWLYPDYRMRYQLTFNPYKNRNIRKTVGNFFRHIQLICTFNSDLQIEGEILKEALKRVRSDTNDGNEIEMLRTQMSKIADSNKMSNESIQREIAMLRNQISKIADSNKSSNEAMQNEIDSIGKTMNSIEKMFRTLK